MILDPSSPDRSAKASATYLALVAGEYKSSPDWAVLRSRLESRGFQCQEWIEWEPGRGRIHPQPGAAQTVVVVFGPQHAAAIEAPGWDSALESSLRSLLETCLKERRRIIPVVFPGGTIPPESVFSALHPLLIGFSPDASQAADRLASALRWSMASGPPTTLEQRDQPADPMGINDLHRSPRADIVTAAGCLLLSAVLALIGNPIALAISVVSAIAAYSSLVGAAQSASQADRGPIWARTVRFVSESLGNETDRLGQSA